jgi:hypothetical protein
MDDQVGAQKTRVPIGMYAVKMALMNFRSGTGLEAKDLSTFCLCYKALWEASFGGRTAGYQGLTPITLATWEAEIRKITVQAQPRQIVQETPTSKITKAKWPGGVVQAIEHLLCNCEALSSNPSPTKIK